MKSNLLYLCVLLLCLNGCAKDRITSSSANSTEVVETSFKTNGQNGSGTLVIRPINYIKESFVKNAVKKDCDLGENLAQAIKENSASQYTRILSDSTDTLSEAQILTIEIEYINGDRGRAKWGNRGGNVGVKGILTKEGKVLGSFKALRETTGGYFATFKGTCTILNSCVEILGSDIASWLTAPTDNARLGDF
jgi:hypothetical protein